MRGFNQKQSYLLHFARVDHFLWNPVRRTGSDPDNSGSGFDILSPDWAFPTLASGKMRIFSMQKIQHVDKPTSYRCLFISLSSKNVQQWSENCMFWMAAETESSVSSIISQSTDMNISFVKLSTGFTVCCVWPLCRPDADGSRSLSIRLFFMRNLDEPQDLQGWESLVFANKANNASETQANLFIHRDSRKKKKNTRQRAFQNTIGPSKWMDGYLPDFKSTEIQYPRLRGWLWL